VGEATDTRGKRGPRRRIAEPVFISKTEMAQHLCLGDAGTLDDWIAKGDFPPPHSRPGERFAVWLRRHWDAYVASGAWPREAWPSA
jgi:predicted DNA-binding transcriptional regulator AlpA